MNLKSTIIAFLIFFSGVNAFAQDYSLLRFDVHGKVEFIMDDLHITIQEGEIIDIYSIASAEIDYYSNGNGPKSGKMSKLGKYSLDYFPQDYKAHEGKIKSIGTIELIYFSKGSGVKAGKIKKIGNINLDYYSDGYRSKAGKLKSINTYKIEYYGEGYGILSGKVTKVGNTTIEYYNKGYGIKSGKIRSVKGKTEKLIISY